MARTMRKFSAGGAQGRYDRRMADIEKDYKKAVARKTGKDAEVAEAKRQQRIADAKDDLAKRTGADRTATRAAEKTAESNLTKTRKYGAPKAVTQEKPAGKVTDTLGAITAPKSGLATADKKPAPKPVSKTPVQKPADKPKPSAADLARAKAALGASNLSGDQGFSSKSRNLKTNATKAEAPKKTTTPTGPSTKTGLNPNSIAGMLARGNFFKTSEEFKKAQEAKYGKAKGGKVKKEKTMNYRAGGSTPPKPSAADRARSKKQMDELKKLKPSAEEGKVVKSANRSEGPGYKKGGTMASCGMKKGGKATKFGAAMKKKSADTKGRAMVKMASGGSVSKRADGCAVKGKTKGKMLAMGGMAGYKRGGKTC